KASILWMDDDELTVGKDYLVKLGTKTIPAIVAGIDYAVDVNTGEHIKTETLGKNGIAVCDILLTEAIVVDVFSSHKTLGELILIDRVTNMTSACGVVEQLSEKSDLSSEKASFKYGNLSARGDIFEEFYYDITSLNVLKYQPVKATYTVGDEIPVHGESYKYPESFDIIVLRDGVSIKVRDRKITEIIPTEEYSYGGVPVINGRGFEVKAESDTDVKQFLKEYSESNENSQKEFFEKWVRFDTYRKVIIQGEKK
ncbi:MAG: sulfate adenylyltransferase, partial [Hominimerdicola sp.]